MQHTSLYTTYVQRAKRGKNNDVDNSKIGGRLASGVTQKMIIVIGFMMFATSMLDILSSEIDAELNVAGTKNKPQNAAIRLNLLQKFAVHRIFEAFYVVELSCVRAHARALLV